MFKFNKTEFFTIDRENKQYLKVGHPIIEPIKIYWSYSSELCITIYTNFFIIFKLDSL